MRVLMAWLRRLFPGWGFAVVMSALAATGWWLHETPRFQSIAWGLTEQVHVHIGWIALVGTALYLVHHLKRTWGPWRRLQRILGITLAATTLAAFVTGIILVLGLDGGPPDWVVDVHWLSTWTLTGLFLWHSFKGAWRAVRLWLRRVIRGPVSVEAAAPAAAEPPRSESPPGS